VWLSNIARDEGTRGRGENHGMVVQEVGDT